MTVALLAPAQAEQLLMALAQSAPRCAQYPEPRERHEAALRLATELVIRSRAGTGSVLRPLPARDDLREWLSSAQGLVEATREEYFWLWTKYSPESKFPSPGASLE